MVTKTYITKGRFAVDTRGLQDQMKSREPWRLVQELVSNAFDEPTCSKVEVLVGMGDSGKLLSHPYCLVDVKDDGQGFERIQDIYTLFGYSKKVQNVLQRGRFNLGEKQFFAVCEEGFIETAGKKIEFVGDERRETDSVTTGTRIAAHMPFTENQTEQILKMLKRIIVPQNKTMTLNGEEIKHRTALRSFEDKLVTLAPSSTNQRVLAEVWRSTGISLYPVESGEKAWLYEMGVPVQSISALWHVDIGQKVPLSPNRDTVRESYLKTLYASLVNNAHDLIPEEKAGNDFVTVGLGGATAEAAKSILEKRFDSDELYFKSGDHRANEQAMEAGFVIGDKIFDSDTRRHLVGLGIVDYAASAFPTILAETEAFADDEKTGAMKRFAKVVVEIAKDTIKKSIVVRFVSAPDASTIAQYGYSTMTFNVAHPMVGVEFFEKWTPENVGVVIHELAHDMRTDNDFAHLDMSFVREIERIAGMVAIKGLNYYVDAALGDKN